MTDRQKSAVCLVARNEERILPEWLAWHKIVGFDAVILFDHDSSDKTSSIAQGFGNGLDVRYHRWTSSLLSNARDNYATAAYTHACRRYASEFDWIMCLDADEFLVMNSGSLQEMLQRLSDGDQIAVPWAIFGSSGHDHEPAGFVTETFTRRSDASFWPNRHVKSIVRPGEVAGWANQHAAWVRGASYDPLGHFVTWERCPGITLPEPDYAVAQVNHYFTRSRDWWEEKIARSADPARSERSWEDFAVYDRNEVLDLGAASKAGLLRQQLRQRATA